ncbi:MAG: Uncharacterised protein [Cryomorphaceae bacterium]|nr:MAG: Uncharacterised protein [Cryomorphaceae bacterium]
MYVAGAIELATGNGVPKLLVVVAVFVFNVEIQMWTQGNIAAKVEWGHSIRDGTDLIANDADKALCAYTDSLA